MFVGNFCKRPAADSLVEIRTRGVRKAFNVRPVHCCTALFRWRTTGAMFDHNAPRRQTGNVNIENRRYFDTKAASLLIWQISIVGGYVFCDGWLYPSPLGRATFPCVLCDVFEERSIV